MQHDTFKKSLNWELRTNTWLPLNFTEKFPHFVRSSGSRISQRGANPREGEPIYYLATFFTENLMKTKEIGPRASAGTSIISAMVVYEKIYFEAYTHDQYIWHKNNITQLYFVLGRAKLLWNFSSWLRVPWYLLSEMIILVISYPISEFWVWIIWGNLKNLWISHPSQHLLWKSLYGLKDMHMLRCLSK